MVVLVDLGFPILNRFVSYRIGFLRSLRRWLISKGLGYVALGGSHEEFWSLASHHIPSFGSPVSVAELDRQLGKSKEWLVLRSQIQPHDKLFPFAINVDTLAMRLGYVVLRNGKPIGGVVLVSS